MGRTVRVIVQVLAGLLAGLVLAAAGAVMFSWLLRELCRRREQICEGPSIELQVRPEPATRPPAAERTPAGEAAAAPDDLKRIEGIGPRIAGVLQAASILTFAQLAQCEVSQIEQILEQADPRLVHLARPATWPEQAALAAAGQWEALEAWQKELKGGRRREAG
jgi:predicted flap endonuclease-1-like 5' DNA nuclease